MRAIIFYFFSFFLLSTTVLGQSALQDCIGENERLVYGRVSHIELLDREDLVLVYLNDLKCFLGQPLSAPSIQLSIHKDLVNKFPGKEKKTTQMDPRKWANKKMLLLANYDKEKGYFIDFTPLQQRFTFIPYGNLCYLVEETDEVHYLPSLRKLISIQKNGMESKQIQSFLEDINQDLALRMFATYIFIGRYINLSSPRLSDLQSIRKFRDDSATPIDVRIWIDDHMCLLPFDIESIEDRIEFINKTMNLSNISNDIRSDLQKRLLQAHKLKETLKSRVGSQLSPKTSQYNK